MSDDSSRTNLITTFHCSECGNKLRLSTSPKRVGEPHDNEDPTGGECHYNKISVHPCKSCIEKHTQPARKLAEAIKDLNK